MALSRRLMLLSIATSIATSSLTIAQTMEIEEVVTIGTRSSKPRSVTDSPVPVDVFSASEFSRTGNSADITDNLKALVPSYTATPATGDGSAFVRPTSLRGMAPDQTLVLINGKRRHRAALVHFFAPAAGNGAHGPDVGMIPGIAIKNVEVLRDGAAAQYGSDAIAGIINFQVKDAAEGGELLVQYGEYYEGEHSVKLAGNIGLPLSEQGFVNLSVEHTDNDPLSRGVQRPDAQALIDAGVAGVGADSPFGDAPLVQTWGRPETSGTRLFFNTGFDLNDTDQLYAHGNYARTNGRYRFFYRNPDHSTLQRLAQLGFTGLPQGYTPYLDGDQNDYSLVGGFRGEFANEMLFDVSIGYGNNTLDYFLNNTINPSLGLTNDGHIVQRDFNVGGYEQEEFTVNVDFSKALSERVNLAFGGEWREESYTINAGEANSYFGEGSNGLAGFRPADAGTFDRDNYALYVDMEHDISDPWLMQYALRYENFSDFGSTTNGKMATRYSVCDTVTLRAALSTGFHAPTPGQANVRTTITTFDNTTGTQIEEGLVPPTSPQALAAGGAPLTEERSLNASMGVTMDIGDNTTLTVDAYKIDVEDRIYRTGDIPIPGSAHASISFYTNALDVESTGVDLVLTSAVDWSAGVSTDFSFALNYNEIEVTGQSLVGGVEPVSEATVEDIENNYPNERFVLSANTLFLERWNLLIRANYYGPHYDERGTINASSNPSYRIDDIVFVDIELGWDISDELRVAFGGVNIFDEYVDEIDAPYANRQSVGLPYPRRSAANYEGGSWYLTTSYRF